MSKKERERRTEKGRESIELGYEVEKGGMILMENVRETTNENERRGEDEEGWKTKREAEKTEKGGNGEKKERERERYDMP